jgi:hypothetical protein
MDVLAFAIEPEERPPDTLEKVRAALAAAGPASLADVDPDSVMSPYGMLLACVMTREGKIRSADSTSIVGIPDQVSATFSWSAPSLTTSMENDDGQEIIRLIAERGFELNMMETCGAFKGAPLMLA